MVKSQDEQKKKKKWGCFGCLWLLFSFFLFILALSIGFFYYQSTSCIYYGLEYYSGYLAKTMTSPEYYQIQEDEEYRREADAKEKSKDFSKEDLQQTILEKKKRSCLETFSAFTEAYKKQPESTIWYKALKDLHCQLQKIFEDQKVRPLELQNFLSHIKKVVEDTQKK